MLSRRGFLVSAAAVVAVAGCSTGGGHPVTVTHAFGTTTVPARPSRVATVGPAARDAVFALGVTPVASGADPAPWARQEPLGGAAPDPIVAPDPIAGPDLIVASGLTRAEFDALPAPAIALDDDWRAQVRTTGLALGETSLADQRVVAAESRLAAAVQEFPQLAGAVGAVAAGVEGGRPVLAGAGDPRVRLLAELGVVAGPDPHVLVAAFGTPEAEAAFRAEPAVGALPVVRAGGYAPLVGPAVVAATGVPTVLSVPWFLDAHLRELAAAVGRSRRW